MVSQRIIIFRRSFLQIASFVYMETVKGRKLAIRPVLWIFCLTFFCGHFPRLRKTSSVSTPRKRISSSDAFETWISKHQKDPWDCILTYIKRSMKITQIKVSIFSILRWILWDLWNPEKQIEGEGILFVFVDSLFFKLCNCFFKESILTIIGMVLWQHAFLELMTENHLFLKLSGRIPA